MWMQDACEIQKVDADSSLYPADILWDQAGDETHPPIYDSAPLAIYNVSSEQMFSRRRAQSLYKTYFFQQHTVLNVKTRLGNQIVQSVLLQRVSVMREFVHTR
jgi:hypothetical protein